MRQRGSIGQYLKARNLQRFLRGLSDFSFNYRRGVKQENLPKAGFIGDHITNALILGRFYEQDILEEIFKFLGSRFGFFGGGIAIDAGANIGNHSLWFSRFFPKVLSFEPHPDTFSLLSINTRTEKKITAYNFGLAESNKSIKLFEIDGNMGANTIFGSHESQPGVEVEVRVLDSFVKGLDRVSLLKIDVEGYELEVLQGSEGLVRRDSPFILIERTSFGGSYSKSDKALEWLVAHEYEFHWQELESLDRRPVGYLIYLIKRWTVGHEQSAKWVSGWPPNQNISLLVASKK
jgi:FkbM family methyltransferase